MANENSVFLLAVFEAFIVSCFSLYLCCQLLNSCNFKGYILYSNAPLIQPGILLC